MGDTHGKHYLVPDIPDGDILVHSGDLCRYGSRDNVDEFSEWFASQPHEHKVVIAGNHDAALQKYLGYGQIFTVKGIHYLEDTGVEIEGLKFWGSPWTLPFQSWSFMLEEEGLTRKWSLIPADTDVLITHGPPAGVLDLTDLEGVLAGSLTLGYRIDSLTNFYERPLVHIFGHIHERNGIYFAGEYRAYNVSILDFKYNVTWEPTVIEL